MMRVLGRAVAGAVLLAVAGCGAGPAPVSGRWVAPSVAPTVVRASPLPPLPLPARTFAVSSREFVHHHGARRIRTVVWTPDVQTPAPAILFSHGLNGSPEQFAPLLTRWARAGYVVIAPAYPNTTRGVAELDIGDVLNQPADASAVLTEVLAGPAGRRIDPRRIAAAGHSAGGITTVGLFTSGRDPRLHAGVVLAGNALGVGDAFTGAPASLLFVHGDADPLVSYASGKAAFDRTPWSKALFTLHGEAHNDPYLRTGAPAYATVVQTTLAFFRLTLYGDQSARAALPQDPSVFDNRL